MFAMRYIGQVRGAFAVTALVYTCWGAIAVADPAGAKSPSASAADLAKKGIEQYKAGRYGDAVQTLKTAYELDGKPETLFALAQAERLAGDCTTASDDYKNILGKVSDLNIAKLVEQSVALCPQPKPAEPEHHDEPPPPPPPKIVEKTILREVPHTDKLAASLFAVGMVSLGGGLGMYVAAEANSSAAQHAYTQTDYNTFERRYNDEVTAGVVAGAVGVALVGFASYRWLFTNKQSADVVIAPTPSGATVSLSGRW